MGTASVIDDDISITSSHQPRFTTNTYTYYICTHLFLISVKIASILFQKKKKNKTAHGTHNYLIKLNKNYLGFKLLFNL